MMQSSDAIQALSSSMFKNIVRVFLSPEQMNEMGQTLLYMLDEQTDVASKTMIHFLADHLVCCTMLLIFISGPIPSRYRYSLKDWIKMKTPNFARMPC